MQDITGHDKTQTQLYKLHWMLYNKSKWNNGAVLFIRNNKNKARRSIEKVKRHVMAAILNLVKNLNNFCFCVRIGNMPSENKKVLATSFRFQTADKF